MWTHKTYTIGARANSRSLERVDGTRNIASWDINPRAYRCPIGILLPKEDRPGYRGDAPARTLPTRHGSFDRVVVFRPQEREHDDYVIVLVASGHNLYFSASEYIWDAAGWQPVEEHSIFLQSDHEIERELGSNYRDLADTTIARRLLEALHALRRA